MSGGTRHFGRVVVTWEELPDEHPGWRATGEVTRITTDGDEVESSLSIVSGLHFVPHDPDGGPNPVAAIYAALDDACAQAGVHITALEDEVVVLFTPADVRTAHRTAAAWARGHHLQPVAVAPAGNFLAALAEHARRAGGRVEVEGDTPSGHHGHYL